MTNVKISPHTTLPLSVVLDYLGANVHLVERDPYMWVWESDIEALRWQGAYNGTDWKTLSGGGLFHSTEKALADVAASLSGLRAVRGPLRGWWRSRPVWSLHGVTVVLDLPTLLDNAQEKV